MKYFEAHYPYYALIKDKTKEDAIKIFVEYVADDEGDLDDEINEVSRDYALIKFSRATGEDGEVVPIVEIIEEFNDEETSLLLIDGSLL